MNDGKTILLEGIKILCGSDEEINSIIVSRRDEILTLLDRYIKEIETFNPAYGLVGSKDSKELTIKHILDSLAPLGIISRLTKESQTDREPKDKGGYTKIADAGSGAGLPGIPLAIALPECGFTLIERMGRRAGFLFGTKAALALSNVDIEESELEKCTAQFDLITFRAFKPLEPKLLKTLLKLLAPGGIIAAYKGRREKIEAEMASLQGERPVWETIPCTVPFLEEERNLLVLRQK